MADIKKMQQELAKLAHDAKQLQALMEGNESERSPENREKLEKLITAGKSLRGDIDLASSLEDLSDYALATANPDGSEAEKAAKDAREAGRGEKLRTLGGRVIESEQFKSNDGQEMKKVPLPGFIKAIFNTTDAQGGYAVRADREPEILDIARQRPQSILDLIGVGQTSVDAVEYVLMATRTNNADTVKEWDTGVTPGAGDYSNKFGIKPQGDLTLDLKTANVLTIAEWIPASRQILADAPNLRSMIDNELMYQLRVTLENKIVSGAGGSDFTGITAWSGVQTRTHKAVANRGLAADYMADTIRRAITDVRLEFYEPDGIVLNPIQGEGLELERGSASGTYLNAYDPVANRIWRVPVIETTAMPSTTGVVGQFKLAAKLWDREQANVRVGEPGNFFLQNAVAILAELRAAFAVTRPKAIEKITW